MSQSRWLPISDIRRLRSNLQGCLVNSPAYDSAYCPSGQWHSERKVTAISMFSGLSMGERGEAQLTAGNRSRVPAGRRRRGRG